jgi:CRISPR/Cas system CSM-associated protein Csm3 (group 7 of RAMP superfamily)
MGKKKNIYRLLVSKTAGKTPLGKSGSKGMCDVKMNFKEMGQEVCVIFICFGMETRGRLM